jgi:hypothetical protein
MLSRNVGQNSAEKWRNFSKMVQTSFVPLREPESWQRVHCTRFRRTQQIPARSKPVTARHATVSFPPNSLRRTIKQQENILRPPVMILATAKSLHFSETFAYFTLINTLNLGTTLKKILGNIRFCCQASMFVCVSLSLCPFLVSED